MPTDRLEIARLLVTVPALFLAIVPPIADLNATHVANPLWPGHARLHTVWLLCSNSLVALLAVGVMWRRARRPTRNDVLLAATLVGAILAGFFVAALTQSAYGGSLTDPNGVAVRIGGVDANLFMFSVWLGVLVLAVRTAWKTAD